MNYEHLLFDLDGTLTDSGPGITRAARYALECFGINIKDDELYKLKRFVGPPLADSFKEFYGFDENMCVEAVKKYREYYKVKGIYENKLYDGIEDLLIELKQSGYKLYVATSKPEYMARIVTDYFDITKYFQHVAGPKLDDIRPSKADVIRYVMSEGDIKDMSKMLMIGDRKFDILGAKEVGIDSLGVLYGYGDRPELEVAGADQVAESVGDIRSLINFMQEM